MNALAWGVFSSKVVRFVFVFYCTAVSGYIARGSSNAEFNL